MSVGMCGCGFCGCGWVCVATNWHAFSYIMYMYIVFHTFKTCISSRLIGQSIKQATTMAPYTMHTHMMHYFLSTAHSAYISLVTLDCCV